MLWRRRGTSWCVNPRHIHTMTSNHHSYCVIQGVSIENPRKVKQMLRIQFLYFDQSPPWHFKASRLAYILTYFVACYLTVYLIPILAFYLAFSSVAEVDKKGTREKSWDGEKFRALVQTLIYKSHCKTHRIVFSEALPLRSGRDHCHSDPGLAVRVRQGPLRSRFCSWGPLILGLLFRSGHCDHELAVEVRRRRRRSRRRRRRPADIKCNNPDVTGGEQGIKHVEKNASPS